MESLNALHVNRSAIDLQKLYGGGIAGRNPQEVVRMKEKHLTVVIKLGTSSIVDEKTHEPLLSTLSTIVETAVSLRHDGHRVVICSSGAIGMALRQMNMERRPKLLPQVQALAAIGQCKLMAMWDQLFMHMRQPVAQILLTRNDIADRTQYLNAQNTFHELLNMGVIPIVNENDTLSVQEIKFGDNDTLSAITAGMVHADYLFLMTDVDCLYDKNPRNHPDAKAIEVVEDIADLAADTSSAGSSLGTGGMSTKIVAARLATAAGVTTVITRSSKPGNISAIVRYAEAQKNAVRNMEQSGELPSSPKSAAAVAREAALHVLPITNGNGLHKADDTEIPPLPPLHTRFLPDPHPIRDRYFWLLHGLATHGTIYIDQGAYSALQSKNGLLPVGVVDVEGHFGQHECVRIVVLPSRSSPLNEGEDVGKAIVNYSAIEIKRIAGHRSSQISEIIGYADSEYVAVRDSVALYNKEISRPVTPMPEEAKRMSITSTGDNRFSMGRLSSYVDA
ncbi:Putative aspartate/glutamate/uridylate kinase, glutamate/acetylglutamate kinase, PUA [Septoria linicola]|uniref:Aspartate/glutamate/uridylate kinase, glutamate/acetylglutamate kinase, PUA n=1 Tax=Septoria linicola TaxID=215465 RepID=A0A9Q9AS60_9PEZI|nr:Putative aspartate/glutamate/uridylate kinase, glutamate/acetylglutamate kinase, PUA [Septoria linicola]